MPPLLDIVIVNWNAGRLLSDCLNSIKTAVNESFRLQRVVVVDNASNDNSLDGIENLDIPLTIIKNQENCGFAKACNQGAKGSQADFLLFLNPDTRLFHNSLSEPILFLNREENDKIGIVGVQILNEKNEISRNCSRFLNPFNIVYMSLGLDRLLPNIFPPHFMIEWDHKSSRIVDQVMGSFLFIRQTLFEDLNGHDEKYFVYFEDLDFSFRAWQNGYKSYYLSTGQIYHKGGGTSEKVKAERLSYILHSKLLYSKKHFSKFSFIIILLVTLLIEPFIRILGSLISGSFKSIWEILIGYKKLIIRLTR